MAMTDLVAIDPLIPCCDYLDHSPGPCACSEHEMSSLHPFGHLRLTGGPLTVGIYGWESDQILVSECHEAINQDTGESEWHGFPVGTWDRIQADRVHPENLRKRTRD